MGMWKWIGAGFGAVAIALIGLVVAVFATGLRATHPAGFQLVSVPDPKGPPIEVAIWYPTKASPRPMLLGMMVQYVAGDAPVEGDHLPLVVISHGQAGNVSSHVDTALALASEGFVVAAPLHTGDNYADQSAVGGPKWFIDRARHITATIDYMLKSWPDHDRIDATKIGMFGFSAGGTTAMLVIGGQPDFNRVARHCATTHELLCAFWKPGKAALPTTFPHDMRIRAAVIAAPGAGFAFAPDGLEHVTVPVQLWNGAADVNVPVATNAGPVRDALGPRVEFHLVPGAGHFSFIVPCGPVTLIAPKMLCSDQAGFDRVAFHKTFNAKMVKFFKAKL
jgi:predicted dienelactone hydrolase